MSKYPQRGKEKRKMKQKPKESGKVKVTLPILLEAEKRKAAGVHKYKGNREQTKGMS